MKASIDENLGPPYAKMLAALAKPHGHSVYHVTDLVSRGTPDTKLFDAIVSVGIKIHITHDHHHRKMIEKESIASNGLMVFVLSASWANQTYFDKAAQLVRWWPLIVRHAERMKPPAIFRVPWKIQGKRGFEVIRNI